MVEKKRVAVIGGGFSGIAAAKTFAERGHEVHGFERGPAFGGVWELSRSYPDCQTQSPKDLYHFTDQTYGENVPEWPKAPDVNAYLHSYAEKHGVARLFRLNTSVETMERRADGRAGWTLTLQEDGCTKREDFDFVSVATGQFSQKHVATHPGEQEFAAQGGEVIHSSDYTDPSTIKGKRVVVLGGSKSALDIAVNVANSGAKSVTLVYRKNVWRLPYFVGGVNVKHLLYMRAQEEQFNGWLPSPIGRVLRMILKPLIWANFRGLEAALTFQLGLKKHKMVPDEPIEDIVSCSIGVATPGFFEALDKGTIKAVQGSIERYEEGAAVLSNGGTVPCDVAVMATGWKQGLSFLPAEAQHKLVDSDGLYRLYRFAVNPSLPDVGFIGFNSSFCSVLSAELVSHWLVRYADGQLEHQPSADEMNASIDVMQEWRRKDRPAAQVYGGLCIAPFHFRHFDELLKDIGATKRKRANPLVELFVRPSTAAYGEFLASAPQYHAG
ncbi:monooxygenase domain-containing protein [Ectocarpus siliculosus]|uniref:Monooxygenase domain-containing protein n=1 Tax=Ectocarpus siliculosus TaxID=2880 RepID=D7G7S8_ECTSI|nr:monooxygenase domain-containing protein [Ectocarpus siliculosus]|eukprot:CBJ27809.1 monooxygenase domain-containing protein [Ectocarpus siliculosus]